MKKVFFRLGSRLFLTALFFSACGRGSEELPVRPPSTSPLSRSGIGYGVINISYIQVRDEPNRGGVSLGYLRKGSVVPVLERRMVLSEGGNAESWVLIGGAYRGWLLEEMTRIFESEAQAATAAGLMTE
ncbi:MAG: hypothetical protein LBP32_09150 [Spirochaetaceae bacterium]|jgi:hypothetical protein|nr:hypothetical protein [Spirochaetaceae bacterium]